MANWAHVENNKVNGVYDLLPKSWRNVSGLRESSDNLDFLKNLGWYPVIKEHQLYNNIEYRENGVLHVFENDRVKETLVLVEKEADLEVLALSFDQLKHDFMINLRRERNKKLLETDWTQLHDVLLNMDDINKNKWSVYRQMLRDLPTVYIDNEIIYLENVNWPNFDIIIVDENNLIVIE